MEIDIVVTDDTKPSTLHPLDSELVEERFSKLKAWCSHAKELQRDSRVLRMRDHDFYDGDQHDEEDIIVLRERGQEPFVYNRTKPTIDWIKGTERRTKVDFRILPREKSDAKDAEVKTSLCKYVADTSKAEFIRSRAFGDAAISGLGWVELGVRSDVSEEPIYVAYEDWRNVWYDPLSVELDLSDARFLFREKWVDVDYAKAMFPDRKDLIEASSVTGGATTLVDYDAVDDVSSEQDLYDAASGVRQESRSRVKLTEFWYRVPCSCQVLQGKSLGPLAGMKYEKDNPAHEVLISEGHASVYDAIKREMRCQVFCDAGVLQDELSPYRHGKFPIVPIWGYRKKRDNSPYGAVRQVIDPQRDLNKRASKSLFLLSSNQVVADDDAVQDWDELAEEVARPDGIIKKKPNSQLDIIRQDRLADAHINLMDRDAKYIEAIAGVTDEQLGRETNARSGEAIYARQNQGTVVTAELFDNLRYSIQLQGEIILSLIEQYYTDEKVIRITGSRGQTEFIPVNQRTDSGVLNDVTASQADFVVDTMAFNGSVRQASFEAMQAMIGQIGDPQIQLMLIDLAFDLSDMPGKEEAIRRIRMVNGMSDPDMSEDDPEMIAKKQSEEEAQQRQAEYEATLQSLDIQEREARIQKIGVEAESKQAKIGMDQQKINIAKAKALHEFQNPKPTPQVNVANPSNNRKSIRKDK